MMKKEETLLPHKNIFTKFLNSVATWTLWPLEVALTSSAREEDYNICFILGPPRSGTTLLFEFLTTEFECAYFSNIAERLYRSPVAATWLYQSSIMKRKGSFDSVFGQLSGHAAPSENGRIWRHWMPDAAPYFAEGKRLENKEIRQKISGICQILGDPMIVKYLKFQSEMPRVLECFPKAIFIYIERDWSENIRSILRERQRLQHGSHNKWFSTRPEGWEAYIDTDTVTQACAQVALCHAEIKSVLPEGDRFIYVKYEDLCARPDVTLRSVEELFRNNMIKYRRVNNEKIQFHVRKQKRFDKQTEEKIINTLKEINVNSL